MERRLLNTVGLTDTLHNNLDADLTSFPTVETSVWITMGAITLQIDIILFDKADI